MAGGLPGTREFKINPKCLVISGGLAGLYWILPPKNMSVLVGVYLIGGYVAVAYYDEYFSCSDRLSAETILHKPFGWLKPPVNPSTMTYGSG